MPLLKTLVTDIQDSPQWAVYAASTAPDAEARYGQTQFENGGLLDDKEFVIDGATANAALMSYTDGDPAWLGEHGSNEDFALWLKEEGWLE